MLDHEIAIIGLGYVGLPLAVGLARVGNRVIGFDADAEVVKRLQSGHSHIQDVSHEDLDDAIGNGLSFTNSEFDLHGLSAYVICVPTPLSNAGSPDLSYVEMAAIAVAAQLTDGALVILESTTYPGTTEELVLPILETGSNLLAGKQFSLAYSPERIDPGNEVFKVTNTPKVVGGLDARSLQKATNLYQELGIEVVQAKGIREAELSKLLENTYRHINIALVNEMVKFCHPLGIDLTDAIRCASTKPFGFQPFYPGPGVGGHCIPIDPNYLSFRVRAELGYSFRFVELAQEINASMPAYVVGRVQDELNRMSKSLRGSKILIAGVTYKADVADIRESPAVPIAEILLERGADLAFLDPFVESWIVAGQHIPASDNDLLTEDEFDCVLVLQTHREFSLIDFAHHGLVVLDTRGTMVGARVRRL